jgi:hypothetical protein
MVTVSAWRCPDRGSGFLSSADPRAVADPKSIAGAAEGDASGDGAVSSFPFTRIV